MDELAKRRARKEGDCTLWSPSDALEDTLTRIREGELRPKKLLVLVLEEADDGGFQRYTYVAAQVSCEEQIALLSLAQREAVKDWTGG